MLWWKSLMLFLSSTTLCRLWCLLVSRVIMFLIVDYMDAGTFLCVVGLVFSSEMFVILCLF